MGHGMTADGMHGLMEVIRAGEDAPPIPGRLAAPVLQSLLALVPCDCVSFSDFDIGVATDYAADEAVDGAVTYLPTPGPMDETFAHHYWGSRFCAYPSRSGDDRSVTLRSDFYSTLEWKQTPMYDALGDPSALYELMCSLPAVGGRSRRVIFFRSGPRDFTEQDRFALALLRPHLVEMVGRRHAVATVGLTDRQRELMQLVADGRTNAEIASALHLSPHTVRTHLANIFERLGVTTRAAAVARVLS